MSTVALVPCRLGSTGIPEKNFRPLAGFALVGWVVAAAAGAKLVERIVVITDALERAEAGIQFAAPHARFETVREPASLAEGHVPDLPVAQCAVETLELKDDDLLVWLRPTSPFVRPIHIDSVVALATCVDLPEASVRSVVPALQHPAKMYAEDIPMTAQAKCLVPLLGRQQSRANHPRQGLAAAWLAAGYVDAMRVRTVRGGQMDGWPILAWPVPEGRHIDIDTEADWQRGEILALERGWRPGQVG